MAINVRYRAISAIVAACLLSGCNPVSRHEVLTTIFEGVPSLPPPEQLCEDYAAKKIAALQDEKAGKKAAEKETATGEGENVHPPYQEKRCDDCHDKSTTSGFITPLKELCFTCHADFIKGAYVHGPVAVGDCLACHVPHNSNYPPLLKVSKKELCSRCHREKRVASGLHEKVGEHNLVCTDCHNPHYGNIQFFLR